MWGYAMQRWERGAFLHTRIETGTAFLHCDWLVTPHARTVNQSQCSTAASASQPSERPGRSFTEKQQPSSSRSGWEGRGVSPLRGAENSKCGALEQFKLSRKKLLWFWINCGVNMNCVYPALTATASAETVNTTESPEAKLISASISAKTARGRSERLL
ncbi:hypothetical protein AOLI_G00310830 [Acnodon oligacanthus]